MTPPQAAPGNKVVQRRYRTNEGSNLGLVPFHVSRAYLKTAQLRRQHLSYFKEQIWRQRTTRTKTQYSSRLWQTGDSQHKPSVMSMLSKNQSLMGTDSKQPKSYTSRHGFSLHTYLRQPPMAALKVKSRNGEVSLQIHSKKLRLHRLVLASAIHRKTCAVQLLPSKAV